MDIMKICYFAQLFLLDEEQLNKVLKKQTKEKDSQLEIEFDKTENKKDLSKLTKQELIDIVENLTNEIKTLNEICKDKDDKFKQFKDDANKKANFIIDKINKLEKDNEELSKGIHDFFNDRNDLLNKLSKANEYIKYLKSIINNNIIIKF